MINGKLKISTKFNSVAYLLTLTLGALVLGACASKPEKPTSPDAELPASELARRANLVDGRGRFREIFCEVMHDHGEQMPDYRSCEQALTAVEPLPERSGHPVSLGATAANYLILVVPGLGWECFEEWLAPDYSGAKHVAKYGYEVRSIAVDGLSSTGHNAAQIRDYIAALPAEDADRPLILVGYSKGVPDVLEALTAFPEVADRVAAVISLAGSVRGSPLAEDATQDQANMLTMWPGSACDEGDNGAVESLKPAVRDKWLAENPLPQGMRYYTIVTYPDADRISWGLRNGYRFLSGIDARNDTQVLIYDQMVPESTLVAYVNADHWAIAVPVQRSHAFVASMFVNHNDYPREAFFEALLRYVEEDLTLNPLQAQAYDKH